MCTFPLSLLLEKREEESKVIYYIKQAGKSIKQASKEASRLDRKSAALSLSPVLLQLPVFINPPGLLF